jgi:ABC-type sugar transport system permease subunit
VTRVGTSEKASVAPDQRRGQPKKSRLRNAPWTPYLYLLPAAAFIVLVFVYPLIEIVRTSLQVPAATGGTTFGFTNYKFLWTDPAFRQAVVHNLVLLVSVPIMTVLALLFSLLLWDQMRGWKWYRGFIFAPYILAIPVVGITFIYLYSTNGIVNTGLEAVGLGFLTRDWLGSPALVLPSIMSVIIYRELGFGTVLFLARMMSIPTELVDAAKTEGANWFQVHRYVTIPQMRSVIEFFVVVEIITMFSWVFAYVYTMTKGGPGFSSTILEFYIWQNAFEFQSPGIAAAAALVLLVAVSGFIFLQLRVRRDQDGDAEQ